MCLHIIQCLSYDTSIDAFLAFDMQSVRRSYHAHFFFVAWVPQIVSDGTIFGDIGAERLRLRRSAVVIGDVTCRSLSVDPDVSISGRLNIHREAPSRLRLEGEYTPEDEVADSGSDDAHDANDKTSRGHDRNHKSNLGANKRSGSSKKDNGNKNKDRHEKGDKNKDDAHRIKAKDGDPSESGESKATKKE